MVAKRRPHGSPRWRFLVERPTGYNPATRADGIPGTPWGRTWTLERDDGERRVVDVEANSAALEAYLAGTLPKAGRVAIQSEGRAAIEKHLGEKDLPRRIRITGTGVRGSVGKKG